MSAEIAVQTQDLAKRYEIGERGAYGTLRETLATALRTDIRRLRGKKNGHARKEHIWALKGISFDVKTGEALGIMGPNGAGKSTLLKILSRITEPTRGRATIRGRVASLLEVGTGFHPELTGRENIYLNGAILGMRKSELQKRFDEIVEFAGVERFIDTPVKRYSSGMHVRLAFAVAAHLDPDVMIVDEVLAVGDFEFQQKCLGKMGDASREGRTVLFVSHNLGSLASLCSRALLLINGEIRSEGDARDVIGTYVALYRSSGGEQIWEVPDTAPGGETARIHAVRVVSQGEMTADVPMDAPIQIEIEYWNLKPGARLSASIHLFDKMGVEVLASANMHSASTEPDEWFAKPHPVGLYRSVCTLPGDFLNDGRYSVDAYIATNVIREEACAARAVSFVVHDTGTMRKEFGGSWPGVVRPRLSWQTTPKAE